jgi:glyoxylase-like metal-dependent hydrolase (beta-lactamase superfamily II)
MTMNHAPMTFGDVELSVVVTNPPWYENCYILRRRDSDQVVLVDPGGDADDLMAMLRDKRWTPGAIVLTHGHFDHLGAVAPLQDAFAVSCRAHTDERVVIERAGPLSAMMTGANIEGPRSCDYFEGEPELELAGIRLKVLQSPGHTPGGVCLCGNGFVLTGDTLFEHGVGRTDLPGGNGRKLTESITRLLADLPEDTVLFAGHGPSWTVGEARAWWRMMV